GACTSTIAASCGLGWPRTSPSSIRRRFATWPPTTTRITMRSACATCSSTAGASSPTAGSRASVPGARCEAPVPQWLADAFRTYGYAAVFVGVLLENAGVPVPGETIVLAGGAIAHAGQLSLVWVIVTAIVAAITGDNVGFAIGRKGGRRIVERFGVRIGITPARLHEFDRFFEKHGAKT